MAALSLINKSHMPYSDSQPVALMRNGTDIKLSLPFLVVLLYIPYVQYSMLYCTR